MAYAPNPHVGDSQTVYYEQVDDDEEFNTGSKQFVVVQTMRDEAFILAELFAAVEEGNLAELEDLFTEPNIDANMCNKHGETVAHIAAGAGRMEILRFLESRGADFDAVDSHGDSTMYWTARQGHTDVIQYLWERGVNVNTQNKQGEYPLHVAARYGHRAAVKLLCSLGANINNVDEHGDTALHIAAWHDFPAIMHVLCQAGALTHLRNREGETALHAAASRGHTESVRCLLEAGAELELLDKHGCSALHLALRRHHVPVALVLLEAGCPSNVLDNHGDAPIHVACRDGLLSLVESLCSFGCDIDVPNKAGLYPIHLAAKNGHDEIIRCLCLSGCNIEQKNKDGVPAEITALAQGHGQIGELLGRLKNETIRQEFVEQMKTNHQLLARMKIKIFGHSGTGKSTLVETLKCGYFSSWFRRTSKTTPSTGNSVTSHNNKSKTSLVSGGHSNSSRSSTPDDMLSEVDSENNLKNVDLSKVMQQASANGSFSLKQSSSEGDVFTETPVNHNYTKGIDIQQTAISGVGEVSLWEFSGFEPYLLSYDHFVGNPYCAHIICFRLTDPLEVQIRQVTFWLLWLQGQSPPVEPLGMGGKSSKPLQIALVGTHADYFPLAKDAETIANQVNTQIISKFRHVFNIHDQVFVVDAQTVSSTCIKNIKTYLSNLRTAIVQSLPRSTGLLEAMLNHLPKWRSASPTFPVLTWNQFRDMVRIQINPLAGEEHLKELVTQLTLLGEVIYTHSEQEDMVVLTPQWLGNDVIGDILGHDEIERAQPSGCYTVDAFQMLYPDTDAVDLLQVLENLKLCTQYDNEGEVEYEFPCYNQMDVNIESVWDSNNPRFKEGVFLGVHIVPFHPFPHIIATLFPRVQVHLRRMALQDNDWEVYQWRNGSKLCNNVMEGLITLERNSEVLEVKVRGPNGTTTNCFYLMEELLNVIDGVLLEVCPGIPFERNLLSAIDLKAYKPHVHSYPATQVMKAMLEHGLKASVLHEATNKQELVYDLLGCEKVGSSFVPGPEVHASQLSALTRQKLGDALDPPDKFGRDWCLLAVQLGMADIMPKLDPGKDKSLSPIAKVLHQWSRVSQSTIGHLAKALQELGRNDAADIVLGTSPLLQIITPVAEQGSPVLSAKIIPNSHPQNSAISFHSNTALSNASSSNISRYDIDD